MKPLEESGSGLTDVRTLLLFLVLMGFWLLLSGQFDKTFLVVSGIVSCLLAGAMGRERSLSDEPFGESHDGTSSDGL